jgi:hypothetical protein
VVVYGFQAKLHGGRMASAAPNGRHQIRESAILGWYILRNWFLPGRKSMVPYSIQWLMRLKPAWFRHDLLTLFDLLQQKKIKPLITLSGFGVDVCDGSGLSGLRVGSVVPPFLFYFDTQVLGVRGVMRARLCTFSRHPAPDCLKNRERGVFFPTLTNHPYSINQVGHRCTVFTFHCIFSAICGTVHHETPLPYSCNRRNCQSIAAAGGI